jgi:flagellin
MPSILSTNMASLYAQRNLASAQAELAGSVQKLSSGKQINSAKDNAAGLGISEGVMGIKNITDQSIRSTQNAISVVQAAEGARDVVGKMLQRMLTLTTQKENTILNAAQTASIDAEISSLLSEVGKIRDRTRFQGGSDSIFGTDLSLIAGAGVAARNISIRDLTIDDLGLSGVGSSKTVNSSDLASLFSRQISASGISIPTAQTMTSVPPSSITGSVPAQSKVAVAATLNGSESVTVVNPNEVTAASANVLPGSAPLPVASIGLNSRSGDVRFYVDRPLASSIGNTGQTVLYSAGSNSSIQGLVNGGIYEVAGGLLTANDYSFQLKSGSVIERLGSIVGTDFSFRRVQTSFPFGNLDVSGNIILGANFDTNTEVVFGANSSLLVQSIPELTLGKTYYVQKVFDNGTPIGVQLKESAAGPAIVFNAEQANGSFFLSVVSPTKVDFTAEDVKASTLNLTGSTFQVGDEVQYVTNLQDPSALPSGVYFVKSVSTLNSNDSIQLALGSATNNAVTFGAITGSGTSTVSLISRANGAQADTITTNTSNGFQAGDAIKYITSGTQIGNLPTAGTYFVRDISGNSFRLADASGNLIDLTSSGSGTLTFTKGTVFGQPQGSTFAEAARVIYDGSASTGAAVSGLALGSTYIVDQQSINGPFQLINATTKEVVRLSTTDNQLFRSENQPTYVASDTITIKSHGFQAGDAIKYTTTSSQIGNLPSSGTYFVRDISTDSFRLADASGNLIDLTSSGSGTLTFTKGTVFGQPQAPAPQFGNGARVVYDGSASTGAAVSGLALGSTYIVDQQSNGSFQLINETTKQVAIISSSAAQLFRNADQLPYVQTDTITIANHGFQNGDAITYSSSNPIINLSSTNTYYIKDVSGNNFKLSTSAGGGVRDLTGYGSGTQSFTKGTVFSQPSTAFTNGAQVVYGGADSSGNAITDLTLNATYAVHNIGNGSSFQLLDSNNKVVGTSNTGTGNQIFNMNSSTLRLPGHGFSVGDQVTYSGATGAGSSDIGNLPRATYTVKAVTTDTFQLQNPTNSSAAISFTSAGSGTQQFSSGAGGPISAASVAAAIQTNARYQAELGMQVNALNFAIDSMETLSSNLAQAYSRIMDVDYATETAALTRNQIMQQAATSMLAQANQMPNVILTLLK